LKLRKKQRKNETGGELYQGVLNRDLGFTTSTSTLEGKETKEGYELIPSELILTTHAGTPAT